MRALRHWWPAMAWAAAMFLFSTAAFGGEHTSRYIIPFLRWLLPDASLDTLGRIHFWIRKAAHFGEYFVFSLLLLRGLRGEAKGWRWSWGWTAVLVSAGFAMSDEFHQSFAAGRGATVYDVLIDSIGAAAAQVCASLYGQRSKTETTDEHR